MTLIFYICRPICIINDWVIIGTSNSMSSKLNNFSLYQFCILPCNPYLWKWYPIIQDRNLSAILHVCVLFIPALPLTERNFFGWSHHKFLLATCQLTLSPPFFFPWNLPSDVLSELAHTLQIPPPSYSLLYNVSHIFRITYFIVICPNLSSCHNFLSFQPLPPVTNTSFG